ncbi:MAG: ferritin family protein [Candidatus Aminicenantales bacterium]
MGLNPRLKPMEILAIAIRSEIDSASSYQRLQARIKNAVMLQKLKFLVQEEKKHRKILERLFSQRFPEQKLKIPARSSLPPLFISLEKSATIPELFQSALQAEKTAEEFYKEACRRMKDTRSQKILEYLSRVERSHYFMIQSEIDLLTKFPDSYNVEDFHFGQELFHIGP